MNLLEITELSKTYPNGVKALHEVSLTIQNGMFGLLGPNGAGKSSLMRTIATLQTADSGLIRFNGVNILEQPRFLKQQLGYLPQEFGVYPHLSALQLLDHIGVLKGLPRNLRREQVPALLHQVNLYAHRHTEVASFSGGMKQRFGIAQALLGNPQLIIVDEPTAGLDPEERNRFNNLLSAIGENIIVILSTHIVEDVRSLCTRMAIVHSGSIIANGSPGDFLQQLKGSVWRCSIRKEELPRYQQEHTILSSQLQGGQLTLHVLCNSLPGKGFEAIEPSLEDVYFSTLSHV